MNRLLIFKKFAIKHFIKSADKALDKSTDKSTDKSCDKSSDKCFDIYDINLSDNLLHRCNQDLRLTFFSTW